MEKVKKNKVVRAWVDSHVNDHYVHMAKKDGYRSRAAYKLIELDDEYRLFTDDVRCVVDLGCVPGSWSQVAVKKVGRKGLVIGIDILPIVNLEGLHFIQGDFTEEVSLELLESTLDGREVDLVLSDMAPNLSGVSGVDQARHAYLVELALDFIKTHLRVNGDALIKAFHGGEFDNLVKQARSIFSQVLIKKPDASRSGSRETYLLCKKKLG